MNANRIEAQEAEYLFIADSQIANSGKGLYTSIKIYKGEIIAIYKGEIISNKEAAKREKKGQDLYFMTLSDTKTLDSMHTDGYAKYANDALGMVKSECKNNAQFVLEKKNKVTLVAKRNISAGSEIFCSYGKAYWKKHGGEKNKFISTP